MNINPEYLARFRAVIVGLDNAPDYATLQFLIGELEELEQALLADRARPCGCKPNEFACSEAHAKDMSA